MVVGIRFANLLRPDVVRNARSINLLVALAVWALAALAPVFSRMTKTVASAKTASE
jgi:hypothetical protein